MRYQHYGMDQHERTTHAGTHEAEANDFETAVKAQAEWEAWRESFLESNPGDYPLRHVQPTVFLLVHEVGHPDTAKRYQIHEAAPVVEPVTVSESCGCAPFVCGCIVHQCEDTPDIEYCALHGAAPELLKACKVLLKAMNARAWTASEIRQAQAAIGRAEVKA